MNFRFTVTKAETEIIFKTETKIKSSERNRTRNYN